MRIRSRFAPSPTGMMHVGNLRTAIFVYLICRHNNGDFILRIEDTDQKRKVDGAVEFIYNTLKLCNINIDEGPLNEGDFGPYFQSERLEIYKKYANQLVEMGHAYYCFCDENRLEKLRKKAEDNKIPFLYDGNCKNLTKEEINNKISGDEKYVIRQIMPKDSYTKYNDIVYGEMSFENKLLEDQILIKSDGYPTYNFANVIDDHLMNITHVIRGNEYLTSTPKYILLYESFGWEVPIYIHLPWVVDENGKKLSKRNNDASFMDLYKRGYLPEAIVNYLALLGWSPETTDEIFSLDDLIRLFDPKRVSKSPAIFDIKKLNWVNSHYIKKLEIKELYNITFPHLNEKYDLAYKSNDWVEHLIKIYQNHISYGEEIAQVTSLFFNDDFKIDKECNQFLKENAEDVLKVHTSFLKNIEEINNWTVENVVIAIGKTKEESGVKGKMLFMPIRIMVSGTMHGPELPDTVYLIGKDKIIERLKKLFR